MPWIEQYKPQLDEHPSARRPVSKDDWREALGDERRIGDWIAFFDTELRDRPWQSVVDEWAIELAPGLVAAGTHGLIRTAHAVRSLDEAETPARRHELAEGLGYWAARYHRLPERRGRVGNLKPSQAIHLVERVRPEEQVNGGLIVDLLRPLDNAPAFPGIADLVEATTDESAFLSDLTETFARVYLAGMQEVARLLDGVQVLHD